MKRLKTDRFNVTPATPDKGHAARGGGRRTPPLILALLLGLGLSQLPAARSMAQPDTAADNPAVQAPLPASDHPYGPHPYGRTVPREARMSLKSGVLAWLTDNNEIFIRTDPQEGAAGIRLPRPASGLDLSPDGERVLVVFEDGSVCVYDRGLEVIGAIHTKAPIRSARFDQRGNSVYAWHADIKTLVQYMPGGSELNRWELGVDRVLWDEGDRGVVIGIAGQALSVYERGELAISFPMIEAPDFLSCDYDPQEKRLVLGTAKGEFWLLAEDTSPVKTPLGESAQVLAVHASGYAAGDQVCHIDTPTGRITQRLGPPDPKVRFAHLLVTDDQITLVTNKGVSRWRMDLAEPDDDE